jgi:hypothetical protein
MPTRERYILDPDYQRACEEVFGEAPEKPYFELFIPPEDRNLELLQAVQRPIWNLETDIIWPKLPSLLAADGVRGDFLEFGVYNGSSLRRLIKIFRPFSVIRRFYGFDSFEGLPSPNPNVDVSYYSPKQFSDTSLEAVIAYLREELGEIPDVELVKGWFSDTLPALGESITSVAFVRVDCDLYESTNDVFSFLEGRLCDKAMIYFDDWTHDDKTGETRSFFEFAKRQRNRYRFQRLLTVSDGALAVRVHRK